MTTNEAGFLDADNHPEIGFRSHGAHSTADGYRVEGTARVQNDSASR